MRETISPRLVAVLLAAAVIAATPARANDPGPGDYMAAAPYDGTWQVTSRGAQTCKLRLWINGSYGAFSASATGCETALPFMAKVDAWSPTADGVALYGKDLTITVRRSDVHAMASTDGEYRFERVFPPEASALAGAYQIRRSKGKDKPCPLELGLVPGLPTINEYAAYAGYSITSTCTPHYQNWMPVERDGQWSIRLWSASTGVGVTFLRVDTQPGTFAARLRGTPYLLERRRP